MSRRLRLVKVIVQPVLVADDGEHLTEMPVQPITVEGSAVDAIPDNLRKAIAALEENLNSR